MRASLILTGAGERVRYLLTSLSNCVNKSILPEIIPLRVRNQIRNGYTCYQQATAGSCPLSSVSATCDDDFDVAISHIPGRDRYQDGLVPFQNGVKYLFHFS